MIAGFGIGELKNMHRAGRSVVSVVWPSAP
jgi:hypothetical protein